MIRVPAVGTSVRRESGNVERAVGDDARVDILVGERCQPEILEDGAARLGGAPAKREELVVATGTQAALETPIALDDEVVVDVLGVEVRRAERVVVRGNRAEAREQEVGPGEQQRQRVRGSADVGGRHERVVAGARLEVVQHHAEVLGDHLAHPVRYRRGHVDTVDATVLHALRAGGTRHSDTPCLEVEHRAALGRAHQALGAGAAT